MLSNENPKIENVVEAIEYFSALLQEADTKGEQFRQLLETLNKAQAKKEKKDVEFKKRILKNAPKKKGDHLVAEKKKW